MAGPGATLPVTLSLASGTAGAVLHRWPHAHGGGRPGDVQRVRDRPAGHLHDRGDGGVDDIRRVRCLRRSCRRLENAPGRRWAFDHDVPEPGHLRRERRGAEWGRRADHPRANNRRGDQLVSGRIGTRTAPAMRRSRRCRSRTSRYRVILVPVAGAPVEVSAPILVTLVQRVSISGSVPSGRTFALGRVLTLKAMVGPSGTSVARPKVRFEVYELVGSRWV